MVSPFLKPPGQSMIGTQSGMQKNISNKGAQFKFDFSDLKVLSYKMQLDITQIPSSQNR